MGVIKLSVLKPPSAEARALAGFGSLLLDMALATVLLFMIVDRTAPPQDLPWKPFSLNQPIGLATSGKLAAIAADPARCKAALAAGEVAFTPTPARRGPDPGSASGVPPPHPSPVAGSQAP